MSRVRPVLAALLACAAVVPAATAPAGAQALRTGVTLDRAHHRLVIVSGPYDLPAMDPMMDMSHEMMGGMEEMGMTDTMAAFFAWPVDGWFRGFRSRVVDSAGRELPRGLLHHFVLVDFDRRTLFAPVAERLAAAGLTPADAVAPATVGAPMAPGQRLGLYIMWHNEAPHPVHGVYLRLELLWTPANEQPRPVSTFPVNLDVNPNYGASNTYDVPPGRHERSAIITFDLAGRLFAAGAHMHDYGAEVRLEDAATGKVLVRIPAVRGDSGKILAIPPKIIAPLHDGLRIRAHHPYRLVVAYDNTSGDTARAVMGEMMGLFAPDDPARWPAVDYANSLYVADLKGYHVAVLARADSTRADLRPLTEARPER